MNRICKITKIVICLLALSLCSSIAILYSQNNVALENVAGIFENTFGDEVELILTGRSKMYISGMVISDSGNIGELDFVIGYHDTNLLVYEDFDSDYQLSVKIIDANTIEITEQNAMSMHGMGASFDGVWKKVK